MASIHETAYPRIKSDPSARDLGEVYTPTPEGRVLLDPEVTDRWGVPAARVLA